MISMQVVQRSCIAVFIDDRGIAFIILFIVIVVVGFGLKLLGLNSFKVLNEFDVEHKDFFHAIEADVLGQPVSTRRDRHQIATTLILLLLLRRRLLLLDLCVDCKLEKRILSLSRAHLGRALLKIRLGLH